MSETICPCGSGKNYADCCEKLIHGTPAETPEALMRARYSGRILWKSSAESVLIWRLATSPSS